MVSEVEPSERKLYGRIYPVRCKNALSGVGDSDGRGNRVVGGDGFLRGLNLVCKQLR